MYYGVKLNPKDERNERFKAQRKERGFDDSETWGLYDVIARFTLPRLKRFRELNNGFPPELTSESWDATIDKMILAMELIVAEDSLSRSLTTEECEQITEGCELFGKYMLHLWW